MYDVDERYGPRHYSWDDVERADELFDEMPMPLISEETGIRRSSLEGWSQRGWIETDKDWKTVILKIRNMSSLPNRAIAGKLDIRIETVDHYI